MKVEGPMPSKKNVKVEGSMPGEKKMKVEGPMKVRDEYILEYDGKGENWNVRYGQTDISANVIQLSGTQFHDPFDGEPDRLREGGRLVDPLEFARIVTARMEKASPQIVQKQ
jgi:hypothetical protein